jgi:hypothetical protein
MSVELRDFVMNQQFDSPERLPEVHERGTASRECISLMNIEFASLLLICSD